MEYQYRSLRFIGYTAFVLLSLVIITDYVLPGKIIRTEVTALQKERQQYYNAGGNSHYSYRLVTNTNQFLVTEGFAETVQVSEEVEYSVSPIFREVNWYRLPKSDDKCYHSLRITSGLVLPLLVAIAIFIAFTVKKNLSILIFVLQVLLIADLVFLLR
jgi:hypothetical protein